MLNSIIQGVMDFRWFIMLSVLATVIAWLIIVMITPQFSFTKNRRRLYAMFVGLKSREILYISTGFCWFVYTVSLLFPIRGLSLVYFATFLILVVLRQISRLGIKHLIGDLLNGMLTYGALFVIASMREYVFSVRFEWLILVIYLLLCLTIINYSLYNFIKDLLMTTKERSRTYEEN